MVLMYRTIRGMGADSCNRGEDGQNKSIAVGGVKRRRISSQALFRQVREELRKIDGGTMNSRRWIKRAATQARSAALAESPARDIPLERLLAASTTLVNSILGLKSSEKDKEQQVISLDKNEEDWIIAQVLGGVDDLEKGDKSDSVKKAKKAAFREGFVEAGRKMTIEKALAGRFLAHKELSLGVEASRFIAHAIGVNETTPEPDDFVAVDDFDDVGSAHMNYTDMSSDMMLAEGGVHVNTLLRNLGSGECLDDRAITALREDLLQSCWAYPSGKEKTCFSKQIPAYVSIEVLETEVSLLHAFVAPVVVKVGPGGEVEKPQDVLAIERLREYRRKGQACWPLTKTLFMAESCIHDESPKSVNQCFDEAIQFVASRLRAAAGPVPVSAVAVATPAPAPAPAPVSSLAAEVRLEESSKVKAELETGRPVRAKKAR